MMINCIDSKNHTVGMKNSIIAKKEFESLDEFDRLAIYLNWKIDTYFAVNPYVPKLTFEQFKEHSILYNEYFWHFHKT